MGYPDCSVYLGGRWLDRDTSDEESCSDKDIEEEVEIETGGRSGGKVVVIGRGDLIRMQNSNGGNNSSQNQGKTVVLGREDLIRLENRVFGSPAMEIAGNSKNDDDEEIVIKVGKKGKNNNNGNVTNDDDDNDYEDIVIEIGGKRNDSDSNKGGNAENRTERVTNEGANTIK